MTFKDQNLNRLVETLERKRQRATYGAVAGVVGGIARSVMKGRDKSPRNSFVVTKKTRLPSGYTKAQCHADLQLNQMVISSAEHLTTWLKAHT